MKNNCLYTNANLYNTGLILLALTLDVLKNAKRFHATVSFKSDTGIKDALDKVVKYNMLMKDFPLNELLSSTDLDKLNESIQLIFSHLNKKLKISPYPINRILPFLEAISRDFNDQLFKILSVKRLMYIDFKDFDICMNECEEVF